MVLGATGFVGRLVALHLAEHAPSHVRIGLAGRSAQRLEAVRATLPGAADWPLLVVDTADQAAVDDMAGRTAMVLTTVGPYVEYGHPVVAACARLGTHYADLTGESTFIRESIERYHEAAQRTGARIVHSAGYDSIPSDLGVLDLAARVAADGAGTLTDTTLVLLGGSGGFGGGSVESLLGVMAARRDDAATRAALADPYTLSPDRAAEPDLGAQPDVPGARFDQVAEQWIIPFLPLGPGNARMVRRSNAMLGYRYGRELRYQESIGLGSGPLRAAAARVGGLGMQATDWALTHNPVGAPLAGLIRRLTPPAGEGPSEEIRLAGSFRLQIHTRTTTGARYVEEVAAQGDPGYTATALMMAQTGLAEVLGPEQERANRPTGVLTPAVAYGATLVDRLRAAGMTFETRRLP